MDRQSLVLAALAPAQGQFYSPVQLQKLFFLIDRMIADRVGGPHFHFEPYDYGPFDKDVYDVVNRLVGAGLVRTAETGRSWQKFGLTVEGQRAGDEALGTLDPRTRDYIGRLSSFVRRLSFQQLVSAIYKAFPEMQVNSVFRGEQA